MHLLPSAFQQGDLIIVDYKRKAYVVHSVHEDAKGFDGVVMEKLGDFLKEASDWAVYRLRLNKAQQQKLASTAIHYAQRKIPFDSQFDLGSQQAMYCTELIWRVSGEVASPNPIVAASKSSGSQYISIEDVYNQDNTMLVERMSSGRNK